MLLFISTFLLILPFAYGIDICSKTTINVTSDLYIESPNYPSNYTNNLNCRLTVNFPANSFVKLYLESFQTEQNYDKLEITIDNRTYVSTGTNKQYPIDVQVAEWMSLFFKTDTGITFTGFNLSVKVGIIQPIDSYNGILNMTGKDSVMLYFRQHNNWHRKIDLIFNSAIRCPSGDGLKIGIDSITFTDACTGSLSYTGFEIRIFPSQSTNLKEILHTSFRHRGRKKCDPDFDCGNKMCVSMETVCDGIYDCENDADEENCESMNLNEIIPENSEMTTADQRNGSNWMDFDAIFGTGHQGEDFNNVLYFATIQVSTTEIPTTGIPTTEIPTSEIATQDGIVNDDHNYSSFYHSVINTAMLILILIVLLLILAFLAYSHLRNRNDDGSPSVKFVNDKLNNL